MLLHFVHSISQSIISVIRVQTWVIAANCCSCQVPFIPLWQCNNSWPCQYNDGEMGLHWQYTVSQLRLCWNANNGPFPLLPAIWWALLPGRPHLHRREGNGMCPDVATHCVKDRREVQQWIGNNLCPTDFGSQCRDDSLVPLTTDRPIWPTRVLRIVSCGCKTGCPETRGTQGCTVHPCAVTYAATFVHYPQSWFRQWLIECECDNSCHVSVLNFVCALLRSFFLLFVSVSIMYAYTHWIRKPIQTYIHHIRTNMPTKHKQYTPPKSATTFYHGRPLWLSSDGHFDFMLISTRRILITLMEMGSPYLDTYV